MYTMCAIVVQWKIDAMETAALNISDQARNGEKINFRRNDCATEKKKQKKKQIESARNALHPSLAPCIDTRREDTTIVRVGHNM